MSIGDFFHGIGHLLGKTFGIIKHVVPEEILRAAIQHAGDAALQFGENQLRRQYVLEQLMKIPGMNESRARLATELAVQHLKADLIEKAERVVAAALHPPTEG